MTTANWHLPAIEAQNLLQNILCYLAPPPICGTPLPIELLSFSGNSLDDANILEWTTSTELDNDYFIVERSSNGSDFEEIQKVDGAGNCNSAISYSIRDNDPLNGINYYRLKQTDFSGNYKHSSIIALKGTDLVSVYPNPADETITIALKEHPSEGISVTIRNTLGQLQTVELVKQEQQIDISDLPAGIYLVEIIIDGKKTIHKFTKK